MSSETLHSSRGSLGSVGQWVSGRKKQSASFIRLQPKLLWRKTNQPAAIRQSQSGSTYKVHVLNPQTRGACGEKAACLSSSPFCSRHQHTHTRHLKWLQQNCQTWVQWAKTAINLYLHGLALLSCSWYFSRQRLPSSLIIPPTTLLHPVSLNQCLPIDPWHLLLHEKINGNGIGEIFRAKRWWETALQALQTSTSVY